MKFKRTILITGAFLVLLSGFLFIHAHKANAFLSNNVMDDIVFDNANSMNIGQINAFLNQFPSSCISPNNGFSSPDPTGYSPGGGFTYGNNVSGGQVVYDAAQAYGLNPQVLLATLQKESSVVSGDASYHCTYINTAMGYGCPDSGSCPTNPATMSGFSKQVIHAAWLLKFGEQRSKGNIGWNVQLNNSPQGGDHWDNSDDPQTCYGGPMTQGTRQACPSGGSSFYDGYTTIDGTRTHMDTGATAAFYWYTPHFSGNQHLDSIFLSWFGNPLSSRALIKLDSSPSIYLLDSDGTTLHPIPSYDIMSAFGLLSTPVNIVNSLTGYTVGSTLHTLIQRSDGGIYLVDNGAKYSISSGTTCTNWGLGCFDTNQVTTGLGDSIVDAVRVAGTLPALQNNNGAVYLMQNGAKEPIISPDALTELGYGWGDVVPISNYNSTQPLGPLHIPNGMAVKYKSGDGIYLYDNGVYNVIPDINLISSWGLNVIANPPASSYDTTPPTTSGNVLSNFATDGRDTYLIDQGMRKYITSGLSSWTTGSTPITSFAHAALAHLPSATTTTTIRAASGGIYALQSGTKRPIPSFNDFYGLGLSTSQLTNISDYAASTIATGNVILPDSALFQVSGNPGIYLVNNQAATWLSTPNDFSYFGFNSGRVEQLPPGVLTAYPASSDGLSVLVKNGSNQVYTASNGTLYALSSSVVSDWGLGSASPTLLSNQNLASLGKSNMTNFARTPNGSIYYGHGGSAHPISSYNEFLSLGGSSGNTINVSPEFIALCPVGSTL
jgi:hypothetical protein